MTSSSCLSPPETELGKGLFQKGAEYLGYKVRGRKRWEYFHVRTSPRNARCEQIAVGVCGDRADNLGVAFDPKFLQTLRRI